MKIRRVMPAVLCSALAFALTPSAANAVSYVDGWANDVTVRYDGCKTTHVQASGDWDLDASNVITVDVYDPDGDWYDGNEFYDDTDGAVSVPVVVCDGDREGRYSFDVEVDGYDDAGNETVQQTSGTFRYTHIERATSRLPRRVYPTPHRKYKYVVPGRLLRNGHGYGDHRVIVEARVGGYWYEIDRQHTSKRGYFAWQFKPNRFAWRYVFTGDDRTKPTKSEKFRTPFKGSGRVATGSADLGQLVARR